MAVPESILKKRRTQEALLAKKAADTVAAKKVSQCACVLMREGMDGEQARVGGGAPLGRWAFVIHTPPGPVPARASNARVLHAPRHPSPGVDRSVSYARVSLLDRSIDG